MTGNPVCIYMITSLLTETYAYSGQNILHCEKLTYHAAHTHTLMSGYHPISQWPWVKWNMIGCQPKSEI